MLEKIKSVLFYG